MFKFRKERLDKDHPLGRGSFGGVYPYKKTPDDSKWAVKRLKVHSVKELLGCLPEIVLGFSCDHPCIVPVKGYSIQPKGGNQFNVHLKLPRLPGGNLMKELERRKEKNLYFSETELVKHFYCLVSAVDYLHTKKIFHGDIKNNNILIDENGNIQLADIGSAKYVPDEDLYNPMTGAHGADKYRAPEIIPHEKALREYNSMNEDEKKNFPMDKILKKDGLFLADSWSLGLAMLEICILKPTEVASRDSLTIIQENLQKELQTARQKYQGTLLDILFGLLKVEPTERLQVSAVKKKLEDNFKSILTEEVKATFSLPKQDKQQDSGVYKNYLDMFNEKANKILKAFEDEKKEKEVKLNGFRESIDKLKERLATFHIEIDKIKNRKNQEIEEMSKKYEQTIQNLIQENSNLLEKLNKEPNQKNQGLEIKPKDMKAYQESLKKVSKSLSQKWEHLFGIEGETHLSIQDLHDNKINDIVLKEFIEDVAQECSKENLWKDLDRLEIVMNRKNDLTDEGLRILSSQLIARLSNPQHLVLNLSSWKTITDDGLKEFVKQFGSKLTYIQHLELNMGEWSQITDTGLKELAEQFGPKITNVNHLQLIMRQWNQITDDGLEEFAKQFGPNLVNIKCLQFDMHKWSQITDNGLKSLADHFGQRISNVTSLELDMFWWNKITDTGFKEFITRLRLQFTHLQELYLAFSGCTQITRESLHVLNSQFGSWLGNLKYLTLGLAAWKNITDNDLRDFASQLLPRLTNVESVSLSLGGWKQITDEGLKALASQIGPQLANLKKLSLFLSQMERITPEALNILAAQITKNLPNLQELDLYLSSCPSVTSSVKKDLENQFKGIPSVRIFGYGEQY